MNSKILLFGFDAFDTFSTNPSAQLCEYIFELGYENISFEIMPVSFSNIEKFIIEKIELHQPDIVLAFGLASTRNNITIEKVGINYINARIPDNEGVQPIDVEIIKNGDIAYFSNLPILKMADFLNRNNCVCSISYSAGTFVCNSVLYLLGLYSKSYNYQYTFIHLPIDKTLSDQANINTYMDYAEQMSSMILQLRDNRLIKSNLNYGTED